MAPKEKLIHYIESLSPDQIDKLYKAFFTEENK